LDLLGFVRQNPDISSVTAEKNKRSSCPLFPARRLARRPLDPRMGSYSTNSDFRKKMTKELHDLQQGEGADATTS
jgi:hypothetical protein